MLSNQNITKGVEDHFATNGLLTGYQCPSVALLIVRIFYSWGIFLKNLPAM